MVYKIENDYNVKPEVTPPKTVADRLKDTYQKMEDKAAGKLCELIFSIN
tara:strand:- start:90 stop:236 length:147 start_codon:yes stop_codon:yes gene_type:complete